MSTDSLATDTSPNGTLILSPDPPCAVRRFTVEQYHALGAAGVLTEDDRVQLLDGLIIEMPPVGPSHAYTVERTDKDILTALLPAGWHVRMQQPIILANSEPEPDVAIVRGSRNHYRQRHPGPDDVGLLIEVADTTLAQDRRKARIYAQARIPHYWIINLSGRNLEVYRTPRRSASTGRTTYRYRRILRRDSEVTLTLDGEAVAKIAVGELV